MTPTQEEIAAGRKAYQGLVGYERFWSAQRSKLSIILNAFTALFMFVQFLGYFYVGKYWMAAWFAAAVVSLIWGVRMLEMAKHKNFELLRQLKEKYGPEIYDEIKKEPDTFQYKLFHKSYPLKQPPPSIELP